eukprot:8672883-Ditylum_brightwellii.AAC.1
MKWYAQQDYTTNVHNQNTPQAPQGRPPLCPPHRPRPASNGGERDGNPAPPNQPPPPQGARRTNDDRGPTDVDEEQNNNNDTNESNEIYVISYP